MNIQYQFDLSFFGIGHSVFDINLELRVLILA